MPSPAPVTSNDRIIPEQGSLDYTEVELYINGSRISNEHYELTSVTVNKEASLIATARLQLHDGDPALETFLVSESRDFIPGNEIELKIGRTSQYKTIFKGVIVKHSIRVRETGGSHLLLDCKDAAVKMTTGRKNRVFQDKTDSDIINALLADNGLPGTVASLTVKHKEMVQCQCTDWDFLMSRAEMNGCLVYTKDGNVNVVQPKTSRPTLTLRYGSTIDEFEAEIDARTQQKEISTASWDYASQSLATATASSSTFTEAGSLSGASLANTAAPDEYLLRHSGLLGSDELKAWAESYMLRSRMAKLRGRVKIKGTPLVMPGDSVELNGLGNRFNGIVYITGVRHEYNNAVWSTQLQFGSPNEWFYNKPEVSAYPAAGLLPAIHGLQIGVVTQLHDDPDGEHRVQIKLPTIDNEGRGIWARMASLDAGNKRGYFFRPEIGDEVIVGFINDDPRFAIVLGMLHSSANAAPFTAEASNPIKGLVTRSEMKTTYDDDKKVIRIETPAGNFVELSEEDSAITIQDQNGNSLKMEAAGITIKSAADIKMEATGSVSVKAQSNASIEALAVSAKANTTMEISGQASTKVSSSGMLEVQGSLVKIN